MAKITSSCKKFNKDTKILNKHWFLKHKDADKHNLSLFIVWIDFCCHLGLLQILELVKFEANILKLNQN